METRAIVFLIIMGVIAILGLAAFLIAVLTGVGHRFREGLGEDKDAPLKDGRVPLWGQVLLALAVLAVVLVMLIWLLVYVGDLPAGAPGWSETGRPLAFLILMGGLGGAGLVFFVIYLLVLAARRSGGASSGDHPSQEGKDGQAQTAKPQTIATPSAMRLLGLLLVVLSIQLLVWIHLDHALEFVLMTRLVYPAVLGVSLVLLFDKASRSWSVKPSLATAREWLLGDLMVFLLLVGFLKLLSVAKVEEYKAQFWDMLFLAGFFISIWVLDRKITRYRFLLVFLFLTLAPLDWLIWETIQAVPAVAEDQWSWWSTVWPFFFWTLIFFGLEIISLIATREKEAQVVPLLKDIIFTVGYAVLMIVAVSGGEGGG